MNRLRTPLVLGLAHGLGDGAAGFLLGGLGRTLSLAEVGLLVLLYNALAFGGQPLAGFAADRLGRQRGAALLGLLLTAAALALSGLDSSGGPLLRLAVALAGVGGALFHVGGGGLALAASGGRAAGPGLFAAPGVLGLALGGTLAATGSGAWSLFLPPLALVAWGVARLPLTPGAAAPAPLPAGEVGRGVGEHFDAHDLVMVVLLAAIALRSAVWGAAELLAQGRYETLLALALAAALGKLLGGPLADRLGWRRFTVGALALAAPLLALGGANLALLLPGVALLQSATPGALAALARQMPRAPATAAGLGLGMAIAIGGLPTAVGLGPLLAAPPLTAALCLAAALSMAYAIRPYTMNRAGSHRRTGVLHTPHRTR